MVAYCPLYNKVTMLILPLTGVLMKDVSSLLYNAYLGNDKYTNLNDNNYIFIKLCSHIPISIETDLKERINYITNYSCIDENNKSVSIYIFRILDQYVNDYKDVLLGKYSKLSDAVKSHIIYALPDERCHDIHRVYLHRILNPTDTEFDALFDILVSKFDTLCDKGYHNQLKQTIRECGQIEYKINLTDVWLKEYKELVDNIDKVENNFEKCMSV